MVGYCACSVVAEMAQCGVHAGGWLVGLFVHSLQAQGMPCLREHWPVL